MDDCVSIIMPAYNAERFIKESIATVVAQTHQSWELLAIDDHSTDGTTHLLNNLARSEPRIRVVETARNSGPAAARNVGIRLARGRYIAFLDSDDLWEPQKLEVQIAAMQSQGAVFCFSSYWILFGDVQRPSLFSAPDSTTYRKMLRGSVIGCLTVVYDTAYFGKRYFNEGHTYRPGDVQQWRRGSLVHEDYALWLSMFKPLKDGRSIVGIAEPLASYRIQSTSFSSNKWRAAFSQWVIYREFEGLSLLESLYYFCHYGIRGVLKHGQIAKGQSRLSGFPTQKHNFPELSDSQSPQNPISSTHE